MTATQNKWREINEAITHNRNMEEENRRHNMQEEAIAQRNWEEAVRSHLASEANTREQISASRYSAEQGAAGRIESAKISSGTSERVARMQTTATAAQKEADRQLSRELNETQIQLKNEDLHIRRILAGLESAKVENDRQRIANQLAKDLRDYEMAQKEYRIKMGTAITNGVTGISDSANKWYKSITDANLEKFKILRDLATKVASNPRNPRYDDWIRDMIRTQDSMR